METKASMMVKKEYTTQYTSLAASWGGGVVIEGDGVSHVISCPYICVPGSGRSERHRTTP